jgi:peptidoglycan L-alanyl-D-glutamate endopeptidase CwlK
LLLQTNPDKANDPQIAALILAQFLKNHQNEIRKAIKANDLAKARRLVNGGSHGLNEFSSAFRAGRRYIAKYLKA